MRLNLKLASILWVYLIGNTAPCYAATYNYSGTVVEATGAFAQLIPVGTPISGYMVFSDAAIAAGFVGLNDLEELAVQVGGFCVFLHEPDCMGSGVPLNSVDNVAVTFDHAGDVTGGEISGVTFSPADPYIPWLFNFDTNTLVSDVPGLGMFTASTTLVQAVPLPGAIWLFASVTLCLAGRRKLI